MRTLPPLLFLLWTAGAGASQAPPRFDGSATLQPAAPASADGRFALDAQLRPAPAPAAHGRFAIAADLRPGLGAKALATACGPVTPLIFSNGFEN